MIQIRVLPRCQVQAYLQILCKLIQALMQDQNRRHSSRTFCHVRQPALRRVLSGLQPLLRTTKGKVNFKYGLYQQNHLCLLFYKNGYLHSRSHLYRYYAYRFPTGHNMVSSNSEEYHLCFRVS